MGDQREWTIWLCECGRAYLSDTSRNGPRVCSCPYPRPSLTPIKVVPEIALARVREERDEARAELERTQPRITGAPCSRPNCLIPSCALIAGQWYCWPHLTTMATEAARYREALEQIERGDFALYPEEGEGPRQIARAALASPPREEQ